jgi:uroporphyrinogen-III synthase
MEALISRYGGVPFVAPSVAERPLELNTELFVQTARLMDGAFNLAVLMTAPGLTYWRDAALTRYPAEQFTAALGATAIISRGPKPVVILHQMGLKPALIVPEPNTWREMVPLIAARTERRIVLQEYGSPNLEFTAALEALGAEVATVPIYRWNLPEDMGPLRQAAHRIADRECEMVIFTTSIQLTHLMEVARMEGIESGVRASLATHALIASVGPIMDAALVAQQLTPDIVPPHPKMGILVRSAAQGWQEALARKHS